jgi:hypothetical protein
MRITADYRQECIHEHLNREAHLGGESLGVRGGNDAGKCWVSHDLGKQPASWLWKLGELLADCFLNGHVDLTGCKLNLFLDIPFWVAADALAFCVFADYGGLFLKLFYTGRRQDDKRLVPKMGRQPLFPKLEGGLPWVS